MLANDFSLSLLNIVYNFIDALINHVHQGATRTKRTMAFHQLSPNPLRIVSKSTKCLRQPANLSGQEA